MFKSPKFTLSLLCAAALFVFAGCASTKTPISAADFVPPLPERPPDAATTQPVPTNALVVAESPKTEPPKPATPKDNPPKDALRPWKVNLTAGSDKAVIDGVTVWLSQPAAINAGTKKLEAYPLDHVKIISPLLNAHKKPLAEGRKFRVFIDPGHGGADPGALSADKKVKESVIVMDIARRLDLYLRNAGYETKLSRANNSLTQTLEERAEKAEQWRADVFVSIHVNANDSANASGFETYVLPAQGMAPTAAADQKHKTSYSEKHPGNAHDNRNMMLGFAIQRRALATTKLPDRGVRRARFLVLREAKMPAVLIECGFVTSPKDVKVLNSSDGRERIARGIYQGICDYAAGRLSPGLQPAAVIWKKPETNTPPVKLTPVQPAVAPSPTRPEPTYQPPAHPATDDDPERAKIRKEVARAAGFDVE